MWRWTQAGGWGRHQPRPPPTRCTSLTAICLMPFPTIPGLCCAPIILALAKRRLTLLFSLPSLGPGQTARTDPALAKGLNLADGRIKYRAVAEAFGMPFTP